MIKKSIPIESNIANQPTLKAPWCSFNTDIGRAKNGSHLHFSGANGFPVASYHSFLCQFTEQFSVNGMDSRGAWRQRQVPPKGFSMDSFAQDLIKGLEQEYTKAVIGVGHSHGR